MNDKEQVCEKQFEECLDNGVYEGIHEAWHLVWIFVAVAAVYGACAWISPYFFPADQWVLIKASLLRIPGDVRHGFMLLLSLVLLDLLCPNAAFKSATSTPLSSAILLGSMLFSLAWVMAS